MKKIEYKVLYSSTIRDYIEENISRKFKRHLKNMNPKYYINGKEAKNYYEIKKDDELVILYEDDIISDSHSYEYDIEIVYETKNYMIINKPRGLKTIPTGYNDFKSLYNAILYYYKKNNIEDSTIHFINRLDKDTEGLLIVAKDKYSASILSKNLSNIKKCYKAICCGIIHSDGEIHTSIKKDVGIKRIVSDDGKPSITKYKVLKYIEDNTLLDIEIMTGRCHQIRVHLQSIGHPILGDPLYGEGDMLHLTSYKIEFNDPFNGEFIHFEIKPWFGE